MYFFFQSTRIILIILERIKNCLLCGWKYTRKY